MKKLKKILSLPLLISISLIISIILYEKFKISPFIFLIFLLMISLILFTRCVIDKNYNFLFGIILFEIFFILFLLKLHKIDNYYKNSVKSINKSKKIIGIIDSYPINKNGYIEVKLKIIKINYYNEFDFTKIKPFMIILKIKNNPDVNRGDTILVNKKINLPSEKINNFQYRKYLFFNQIYGIIYADKNDICFLIDNSSLSICFFKILWKLRTGILNKLRIILSEDSYGFILSIIFGDRNEIDKEINNKFFNTGLVHLLAISGLQISFIGLIILKFFNIILSRSKSFILSIIILAIYVFMLIPSSSSTRAFFMFLIYALFFVFGISTSGITILSFSAILLIFINPFCIFDLGFQFSSLATAGILFLSKIIEEKIPKIFPEKIKPGIATAIAAFFSVFILQWAVFQKIPFFSLISSIIIIPIFNLLYAVLFLCILIIYLFDFSFIVQLVEISIRSFLSIIDFLNIIPMINMPEIPAFFSYLFLPLLILYFYNIDPYIKKSFIRIKFKILSIRK